MNSKTGRKPPEVSSAAPSKNENANGFTQFKIEKGIPLPKKPMSPEVQAFMDKFRETLMKLKAPTRKGEEESFPFLSKYIPYARKVLKEPEIIGKYTIGYIDKEDKTWSRVWKKS